MEDFLSEFPELSRETLRFIKKGFDASYRAFSREYGDAIEACLLYTSPSPRD